MCSALPDWTTRGCVGCGRIAGVVPPELGEDATVEPNVSFYTF